MISPHALASQVLDLAARQAQAESAFLEICSDETGDVEAGLLRSKLLNLIKPGGDGKADARLRILLDDRLGGSKAMRRIDFDGFVEVRRVAFESTPRPRYRRPTRAARTPRLETRAV